MATRSVAGRRVRVRREVPYSTQEGHRVWLRVSERYTADIEADQTLVTFLSSLTHGQELSGLRVMVLAAGEIGSICGPGAAACYFPGTDLMVIVGEDRFGGLPTDYVIAHEYGHRVAQFQFNPPFRGGAFANGPKRWASHAGVCPALVKGELSIGPLAYWDFPGENFAEAYAQMHIRGQVKWQYSPLLEPTADSFARIRADIERPWERQRITDHYGLLRPGQAATYWLRTPLDGKLDVDLEARGRGPLRLSLARDGRVLKRSPRAARYFRISQTVCGNRRFKVEVKAGPRGGRYRLTTYLP